MSERELRTNADEESHMIHTEHDRYRRAFWIALTTIIVLAIAASVLWWRLNHAGAGSQPGDSSAQMQGMSAPSATSTSGSEPGAAGEMQTGKMQEIPLAP